MHPTAARLFGAFVHKLRNEFELSAGELVQGANRGATWLDRVEHGLEDLDAEAIGEIANAFAHANVDVDVFEVAAEILADPQGPLASYLATVVPDLQPERQRRKRTGVTEFRINLLVRSLSAILAVIAAVLIYRISSQAVDPVITIITD